MDSFSFEIDPGRCRPYLDELAQLFEDMDAAYARVAGAYGFHCTGCENTCCRSLFYHHTLLEYLYLSAGLMALPADHRDDISNRARRQEAGAHKERAMCPVNLDGRCRLYRFRPMICRLHGVAYTFIRPDNIRHSGPGCDAFTLLSKKTTTVRLDRTPFYHRMALLEKGLREQAHFKGRFRMTIAQMVLFIVNDAPVEITGASERPETKNHR